MDFLAIFHIAIRALTRNKMRSILDHAGHHHRSGRGDRHGQRLGQGAQQQAQEQIAAMGTNMLYISSEASTRAGSAWAAAPPRHWSTMTCMAILQQVPFGQHGRAREPGIQRTSRLW